MIAGGSTERDGRRSAPTAAGAARREARGYGRNPAGEDAPVGRSPRARRRVGREWFAAALSRRATLAVAVLAAGYVAAHLATITISRLPWFDDTFFTSLAESIRHTGEYTLTISPLWLDKPVLLYGPVYLLSLAWFFDLFGVGIVQARLPGLLCGFGILAVGFHLLWRSGVRSTLAVAAMALLALDPTFHQSIHSGRTDSMALFLLLASFGLVLEARARRGRAATACCVASGLLGALGALATPRPGYLLIPMGLVLLHRWVRRPGAERAVHAVAWGGTSLACLGIWVVWAFGGVPALLSYYAGFTDTYASGGFGVRAIHTPLLAPVLILMGALLVGRPRALGHELLFFCVAGILGFYVFVKDKGTFSGLYAFFMIPFAYLALGYCLSALRDAQPRARIVRGLTLGILGGLLAFNGGIFVLRSVLELAQRDSRDPATANAVVARTIPPGSRVVGDDKYFFAVLRAGSEFQYAERGGTLAERVRYHKDVYDLQYLITSEPDTSDLVRAYSAGVPLVVVATIPAPPDSMTARWITALARSAGIGSSLTGSYQGRIFARVVPGAPPS